MSFENTAQEFVFGRLSGFLGAGVTVFDTAPYLPEGEPATSFPYCVIGNDTATAWDTDDQQGASVTLTLHFWSRATGFKQIKAIMALAYARLHRANATVLGYNIVDCFWEFSEALADQDGVTKHGIQRYRLTIQKENG
jgi:hypothetical protein